MVRQWRSATPDRGVVALLPGGHVCQGVPQPFHAMTCPWQTRPLPTVVIGLRMLFACRYLLETGGDRRKERSRLWFTLTVLIISIGWILLLFNNKLQSRGKSRSAKRWGVEREHLAPAWRYVVSCAWLTRLFHLNKSISVEAGLLQKHFPSQNTNWPEKTLTDGVITTIKTHLTFNVLLLRSHCLP